jgi:hypothetical protein
MKKIILALIVSAIAFTTTIAQHETTKAPAIEGRWDLSFTRNGKELPSWLEVNHSGIRTFVGHFVGAGGKCETHIES